MLFDRCGRADDASCVHLDEVPGLGAVDAHEQVRRAGIVDIAHTPRDEDGDRAQRPEARHVEVATEDPANVGALEGCAQPGHILEVEQLHER